MTGCGERGVGVGESGVVGSGGERDRRGAGKSGIGGDERRGGPDLEASGSGSPAARIIAITSPGDGVIPHDHSPFAIGGMVGILGERHSR